MRNMRKLLILTAIAGLSAAASGAAPAAQTVAARVPGSESISLRWGHGYAAISRRGAVLGRLRRGLIRVTDVPAGGSPQGYVRGCEERSGSLSTQLTCRGSDLRLYIHGGTWRVRLRGKGINVGGVVRGSLVLDAADGCPETACKYQIGDAPVRSWPATLTSFAVRS
jgi:hypothetical protein